MFESYKNQGMKTPLMFSNSSPPISPSEKNQGMTNPTTTADFFPMRKIREMSMKFHSPFSSSFHRTPSKKLSQHRFVTHCFSRFLTRFHCISLLGLLQISYFSLSRALF